MALCLGVFGPVFPSAVFSSADQDVRRTGGPLLSCFDLVLLNKEYCSKTSEASPARWDNGDPNGVDELTRERGMDIYRYILWCKEFRTPSSGRSGAGGAELDRDRDTER
jgi:hypothetical protein